MTRARHSANSDIATSIATKVLIGLLIIAIPAMVALQWQTGKTLATLETVIIGMQKDISEFQEMQSANYTKIQADAAKEIQENQNNTFGERLNDVAKRAQAAEDRVTELEKELKDKEKKE